MQPPLCILLLEDNPLDAELIEGTLRSDGVECEIDRVDTREGFEAALGKGDFDLVFADYSLPAFDGMTALAIARRMRPDLPFIIVSGRIGEEIAIEALKSGATDYVLKNNLSRLAPSIRRTLRETEEQEARRRAEEELRKAHAELELRVKERTAELATTNEVLRIEVIERKRVEERLRESEARLQSILKSLDDCIWSASPDGTQIHYLSQAVERIFGRPPSDFYAAPQLWLETVHSDERAKVEEAFKALLETGELDVEYQIVRPDGATRWVHNRGHSTREENGRSLRLDGIATDITEKKSLEVRFLRAQRLESIGRLASGIAHDLNNILSPVLMGAQMLQLKLSNADDQRLLEIMLSNVERGADIVKQILLFARGVQGERIPLQLRHLIREIIKVATETFPKSVQVKSSILEDPWMILGDNTQIHQVLLNLCINARDAMPDGGTLMINTENVRLDEIYARMNPEARPGEYVMIAVADTGEGIPQQLLSKIFDPFFTTKEQGKGTGLGLSTVQGIVKGHGGFVNVYSEVGKGTEFKIYLPVAESPYAISEAVQTDWPMGDGELILVVDDEAAVRELAKNVLETFGYRALVASDGAEAMAIYAERRDEIRVVVTDLMMPVMDGPATIRSLQRLDPEVKIIAVSGLSGNGRMLEATQAGVKSFLPKPYTADRLLKAISEILK
ncbi:MAG TPA: response regulator [Blastocatellia bacterium]|nr:response regulator [Blastocatellia bacterium]